MSEANRPAGAPRFLLTGRKLQIAQLSDSRLMIRSGARWFFSLLMFVECLLMSFGLALCVAWVYMAIFHPAPKTEQNVMGVVCGLPCLVFFASMLVATFYMLLTLALPKFTLIDLDSQTIFLRQIPGFSRKLHLNKVTTVDLVMFESKGTCHLGFTSRPTGALFSFHWLGGQFDSAIDNRNHLLPAARLIAEFVNRPLESSWGHVNWSLRKGASEPLPSP